MMFPKTIIELDKSLNKKQIEKIKLFFENLNVNEIEIYEANNYARTSEFANDIYHEIINLEKEDINCDMYIKD